jgi:FtsX-like permease family protein
MRAALWLALRDVSVRWRRALLAIGVVASVSAAAVAMELVARAREQAVAARIDAIGPPLTVVPAGVTAGTLARLELGDAGLDAGTLDRVRAVLGGDVRWIEPRLVARRDVGGVSAAIVGIARSGPEGAEIGAELARRLGAPPSVAVSGVEVPVTAVRPSTGDVEDVAVFVPLELARRLTGVNGPNELRLYLKAGVASRDAEARLRAARLSAAVVRTDRGVVADAEAQDVLARHRRTAQLVLAVVAALCLLLAAHLDASERRLEIATLVAIGTSRSTVLGAIVSRSAVIALAGAVVGTLAAAALAALQDPGAARSIALEWPVAITTIVCAVTLGIGAAAPTALASAMRDPVPELQEAS